MTVQADLDDLRALMSALIECLASKSAPGSYATILLKEDVETIKKRRDAIIVAIQKERQEAASRLLLPPGAKA